VDVICAVEKVGNNGAEKVKEQTGIDVKTIMKIVVRDEGVNVF
jgi:adenine phosphoribosyltransferase